MKSRGGIKMTPWRIEIQSIRKKLESYNFEFCRFKSYRTLRYLLGPIEMMTLSLGLLNDQEVILTDGRRYNLIEVIMSYLHRDKINNIWKINLSHIPINILIDLLWYINYCTTMHDAIPYSNLELNFIFSLTVPELIDVLGTRYSGPHDQASLLFAVLYGYKTFIPPNIELIPRYREIVKLPCYQVWGLANLYDITTPNENNPYPPYTLVTLAEPSILNDIILYTNKSTLEYIMEQYQIVFPPYFVVSDMEKVMFCIKEVKYYDVILSRSQDLLPPPPLNGMTFEQWVPMTIYYTLKELIDTYDPEKVWMDRKTLLHSIFESRNQDGSIWSWRNLHCNNDETNNVLEWVPHGSVDKNNPYNLTLSYGVSGDYRCYQITELIASFRKYDDVFRFAVPDWVDSVFTHGTNYAAINEFPVNSMDQLVELLEDNPYRLIHINELLTVITQNIKQVKERVTLTYMQDEYNKLSDSEKEFIKLYLSWVFIYGMWMRFWRGPGYPWPLKANWDQRCHPEHRDIYIIIQNQIHDKLKDAANQSVTRWINKIPVIDYNFNSKQSLLQGQDLETVLDEIIRGERCMGFASNELIGTAFVIITTIFKITTPSEFSIFIQNKLNDILNLERTVITDILNKIDSDSKPETLALIKERITILKENDPILEPFQWDLLEPNIHT